MKTIRNNVQLIGNLGKDPEVKTLPNGKKVANILIACSDSHTNGEGQKIDRTDWFHCVAWEGLATIAEKYMVKGKRIAISGRLHNKTWTDAQGEKRTKTEIVITEILLLGGGNKQ